MLQSQGGRFKKSLPGQSNASPVYKRSTPGLRSEALCFQDFHTLKFFFLLLASSLAPGACADRALYTGLSGTVGVFGGKDWFPSWYSPCFKSDKCVFIVQPFDRKYGGMTYIYVLSPFIMFPGGLAELYHTPNCVSNGVWWTGEESVPSRDCLLWFISRYETVNLEVPTFSL